MTHYMDEPRNSLRPLPFVVQRQIRRLVRLLRRHRAIPARPPVTAVRIKERAGDRVPTDLDPLFDMVLYANDTLTLALGPIKTKRTYDIAAVGMFREPLPQEGHHDDHHTNPDVKDTLRRAAARLRADRR